MSGIARHAFQFLRRPWPLRRYAVEEAAHVVLSLVPEAELALEHALELDHDRLREDEDDPAVDRVLDPWLGGPSAITAETRTFVSQTTRRVSRARLAFRRRASASSGPIPRRSACARP